MIGELIVMLYFNNVRKLLTISKTRGRLYGNLTGQTVEAEITAVTTSQRARDDENRAGDALSNGPLRARGKGVSSEYSATQGRASVAGDMMVSRQEHGSCRESGWHRGKAAVRLYAHFSSLTGLFLSRTFLLMKNSSDSVQGSFFIDFSGRYCGDD